MNKLYFFILAFLVSLSGIAQINFEKGYFINNQDEKTECFIKNMDWKNNPTQFKYKLSEDGIIETGDIATVKEFGNYDIFKYVRATVNIDQSSKVMYYYSDQRNPEFEEKTVFLKVLIDGNASLYVYEDQGKIWYFYNKKDSDIEQLIYKRYKVKAWEYEENNQFRQQLFNDLKCEDLKIRRIENLDYNEKELVRFFSDYNKCKGSEIVSYKQKSEKAEFHLTVRPRLNIISLKLQNTKFFYRDIMDFGSQLNPGFGLELEYVLPFNKNKWSISVEPTYQNFKTEKIFGGQVEAKVDYTSIELPLTVRYYLFLSENSKIFLNASYVIDLETPSKLEINRINPYRITDLDVVTNNNMAFGIGYKYNDKYSAEVRLQTSRDIRNLYYFWRSDYKTLSFILGYSIF